jgi:hypothetical protein
VATTVEITDEAAEARWRESQRRDGGLASLSAHLSAATARWLELAWELREDDAIDDLGRYLAFRCGITVREAREYLRVAEDLQSCRRPGRVCARGAHLFEGARLDPGGDAVLRGGSARGRRRVDGLPARARAARLSAAGDG